MGSPPPRVRARALALVLHVLCVGAVVGAPATAVAEEAPTFAAEVAAARRAKLGCADIPAVIRYDDEAVAARVVAACRAGRWRLEWIVCHAGRFGACDGHLTRAQRAQLERALAPVVETGSVRIDRVAVVDGALLDRGAGAARWASNTLEACAQAGTVGHERATIRVRVGERAAALQVRPAGRARRCLEGRLAQLVWTDGVPGTTVVMSAQIRPPGAATRKGRALIDTMVLDDSPGVGVLLGRADDHRGVVPVDEGLGALHDRGAGAGAGAPPGAGHGPSMGTARVDGGAPSAPAITTAAARIERVAVEAGALADGGAGAARWASAALEACARAGALVGRERATIRVRLDQPPTRTTLQVLPARRIQCCLQERLDDLVWADGAPGTTVVMTAWTRAPSPAP